MPYFILKFSLIKLETPDVFISTPNSFIVTNDNSDWLLKKSLWTYALASIEAYPLKVAVLNWFYCKWPTKSSSSFPDASILFA